VGIFSNPRLATVVALGTPGAGNGPGAIGSFVPHYGQADVPWSGKQHVEGVQVWGESAHIILNHERPIPFL